MKAASILLLSPAIKAVCEGTPSIKSGEEAGNYRFSAFKCRPRITLNEPPFLEPINVCTERRAVVMIFKGVARVEEHNGHMLHSQKLSIHAPSVIRLTEYIHIPFERRSLSRKNILLRDHSTCQYCGKQYTPSELTLDHVLPRSRGGESAWDNLVACCKRCNHRKGNRTPEESGMHLLRRPRGFSLHVNRQIMRYLGRADETWRKYLFYESNNGD